MAALRIPLIYLRDKQAFRKEGGMLRLIGKPLDYAKDLKKAGCMLVHIVDMDALLGMPKNLDVYDNLTYVINVEVECAAVPGIVTKLLSLKCRVVLPPQADVASLREKKLLVAKIPDGYTGDAEGFSDVVLECADDGAVKRFIALGKRVIIYEKDEKGLPAATARKLFGVIAPPSGSGSA
jgi:hypothetical protein